MTEDTSTIQPPTNMCTPGWQSLVHEAAAKLPAGLLETVGLAVGAVTIRAGEYSARISVAGVPRHPDDASVSTTLDDEGVRTLHAILGVMVSRWDAAEPA